MNASNAGTFAFLKEAKRHSEPTVDAAAKALNRFEFIPSSEISKAFHFQQVIAIQEAFCRAEGQQSGEKLSKATLHATLSQLKRFFQWLARQPSYRSRLQYSDAEYFNCRTRISASLPLKGHKWYRPWSRSSTSLRRCRPRRILERRNRALVAFTLLTGARDSAIASMNLKHVDLITNSVDQDAREVKTKIQQNLQHLLLFGG